MKVTSCDSTNSVCQCSDSVCDRRGVNIEGNEVEARMY